MTREEAIKAIKTWDFLDKDEKEVLETLIPELAESEDERIKKDIIRVLKGEISFTSEKENEKYIAWLEKQGVKEQDVRYENLEELLAADDIYQMAMNDEMVQEAKEKAVNALSEMCIGKLLGLEKQGEKKPADKVEQKFNEGEWVILTAGELSTTLQIVKVDTNKKLYWFNDSSYLPIVDEECLHLWTIADAKPGDVLEFGDHGRLVTGILSFVNKNTGKVDVSCLLEGDKFKVGVFYNLDTVKPHPATKEQRDTLMKAMADAGYTFDFGKKELKKIEKD